MARQAIGRGRPTGADPAPQRRPGGFRPMCVRAHLQPPVISRCFGHGQEVAGLMIVAAAADEHKQADANDVQSKRCRPDHLERYSRRRSHSMVN